MGDLVARLRDHKAMSVDWDVLRAERDEAADEIERLNLRADGMTDAALKERRTGEEYQRELRGEIERLNKRIEELERERTERR